WFELWPSSMNMNIPNLNANRRLFRSYEPFMSNNVVKISARVPQDWKINRRMFHRAVSPFLKPTKWLLHSDGRLPYFPWYINNVIQFRIWGYRQIGVRTGIIRGNQGPWGEWNVVMNSKEWNQAINTYLDDTCKLFENFIKEGFTGNQLFDNRYLNKVQQINLMQVLYGCHKRKKIK